ncbi:hypothetical protein HK102_014100 [Quaeritorhiza haematococci]|nr:hypothetical protein HK102_014100 [Quaeritorhiza haematococci]
MWKRKEIENVSATSKASSQDRKNKSVEIRAGKDEDEEVTTAGPSVEAAFVQLQRKAKQYEVMKNELADDEDCLVDFVMKQHADKSDTSPPRADKHKILAKEGGTTGELFQSSTREEGSARRNEEDSDQPSLMSADMVRERERSDWEANAMAELERPTTHYDNRKEIRQLGVGHYQFSTNEEERREQMRALKEAREETLLGRERAMLSKNARKEKLNERRKAIMEKAAAKRRKVDVTENGDVKLETESEKDGAREDAKAPVEADKFLSGLLNI